MISSEKQFFPEWWLVYSPKNVARGFLQAEIFWPATSSRTQSQWMSACFLPYSKELLRCEYHLVPSQCRDCKTELQTLISSCFFLLLNFLGIHRGFKLVKCYYLLCYAVKSQPWKCFLSCHLWCFFLATRYWVSNWRSFVFECSLSCKIQIWVVQESLCESFLENPSQPHFESQKKSSHVFMST